MKLTYLKTVGFRKFEHEFETNLYDTTFISGANTSGKTNILHAIIWGFLGTSLTGDERIWQGHNNSEDCYVEIHFLDEKNIKHELIRYKNKYINSKNFIVLDNLKISQENLMSYCNDKKLFLSIINPNYFINKSPAEQKELLDKYLPRIDTNEVFKKLDLEEQSYIESFPDNIVSSIKDLNDTIKRFNSSIINLNGKIDYARNIVNTPIESLKTFDKLEELDLERQELSFLKSQNDSSKLEKQQNLVNSITSQIAQIENTIKDLDIKMQIGKQTYLNIKMSPISHCPTCAQSIQAESKQNTIINMKKSLEDAYSQKLELVDKLGELKKNITIEKCNLHALETTSNLDIKTKIVDIQNRIKQLEQEQLDVEKYNQSILIQKKNIENAQKDIEEFNKQIKEYLSFIDNAEKTKKITQKLYINYIEEKMKPALQYLDKVKIRYFSVLKDDGVIKEDFVITYNNTEIKKLSRSEFIDASLELSNMLNKISKSNIPLFIDDSESCVDFDFIEKYSNDTQVLIAKVEKGQDLQILDNSNYSQELRVA